MSLNTSTPSPCHILATLLRTCSRVLRWKVFPGFLGVWTALTPLAVGQNASPLEDQRRIVALGDSITYDGRYLIHLECFLRTRLPSFDTEILNLGLPSETVSGLSEPGHADGKFPRPVLQERLQRLLQDLSPSLVTACYGMNDGIYSDLSPERFAAFKSGIQGLRKAVAQSKASLIHLTPPPFTYLPPATPPAPGAFAVSPIYDQTLAAYSEWLLAQNADGWRIVDIRTPLRAYQTLRRQSSTDFRLAEDGVHLGAIGHWLLAETLFDLTSASKTVDHIHFGAAGSRSTRGKIEQASKQPRELRITAFVPIPLSLTDLDGMPAADLAAAQRRFNDLRLFVTHFGATNRVEVSESGSPFAFVTGKDLEDGLALTGYRGMSLNQRAAQIRQLVTEKQTMLRDAWLKKVGHLRPGIPDGLTLTDAQEKAESINARLKTLCAPMRLEFRLRPATPPPSQ